MATLRGRIHAGRVEVDDSVDLPDGTAVELAVFVDHAADMGEQQRTELARDLRQSLREAERGEDVPMELVLDELAETIDR